MAMPNRPPSPVVSTPLTASTGVTVKPVERCGGPTRTIVADLRSVTSALPSGRNASPHGVLRCRAMTSDVAAEPSPPDANDDGDGLGRLGGAPPASGGGGPNEQPATNAVAVSPTADQRRRKRPARCADPLAHAFAGATRDGVVRKPGAATRPSLTADNTGCPSRIEPRILPRLSSVAVTVWVPYPYPRDLFADLPVTVGLCPGPDQLPADPAEVDFLVPPFLSFGSIIELAGRMPNLRVIQLLSAGVDAWVGRIPEGITLCDARGVHNASTAEWALT